MGSTKITFPVIRGTSVWRNAETGIEIHKSEPDNGDGTYYTVQVPGRDPADAVTAWSAPTLAEAREYAVTAVEAYRRMVADAYSDAITENAKRAIAEHCPELAPERVEYAGSHVYRGPGLCKFEDCGARATSPVHRDERGMRMGPGHVAPATIEQAWAEALD